MEYATVDSGDVDIFVAAAAASAAVVVVITCFLAEEVG